MIIRELYLKSFGKFSETKIELEEGFHIFYGENEFGKSTLHAFIRSMLFGLTKGRGRAAKNDLFTKYEPWDQPSYYAGEMTFESGDRTFIISRRFDRYGKSASLVCQTDGEILSVEQGDMDMLLDGMSEAAFENTISIGQTKAETSADLSAELRNYAANYYCSGNSEMDVERALAILKERRKTVENRQKEIRKKKQEKREKVEQQAAYISEEIERKQAEEEQISKNIEQGKQEEKRIVRTPEEEQSTEKQNVWDAVKIKLLPVVFLAVVAGISLLFQGILKWSVLSGAIILEIVFLWKLMEAFRQAEEKVQQETEESREAEKREISLEHEQERHREALRRMVVRRELLREEIAEKQMQYENLCEQGEELMEVSEEYVVLEEKGRAIQLAEDTIRHLSTDVRKEFGTRLNEVSSEILCAITDGKYDRIFIDENTNIYLLQGAQKISVGQVSRGTMEQIYFALRMASAELMYEEEFPVILDETFAYYDERRLENTLRWLAEKQETDYLIYLSEKRVRDVKETQYPISCDWVKYGFFLQISK